ncbi:UNKNOWN [Stylonychia lemnae]|uniref:Uncharacterized protein n=1 Tax=Stylonychia lemnae TaxID=5949 RepID=A0A078AAY4_STYLE|nr:UNKNOWN [Stylonychia lemnae]|eukprot:CDW78767.1 UNKNOWN [Stylonychia lemnae]
MNVKNQSNFNSVSAKKPTGDIEENSLLSSISSLNNSNINQFAAARIEYQNSQTRNQQFIKNVSDQNQKPKKSFRYENINNNSRMKQDSQVDITNQSYSVVHSHTPSNGKLAQNYQSQQQQSYKKQFNNNYQAKSNIDPQAQKNNKVKVTVNASKYQMFANAIKTDYNFQKYPSIFPETNDNTQEPKMEEQKEMPVKERNSKSVQRQNGHNNKKWSINIPKFENSISKDSASEEISQYNRLASTALNKYKQDGGDNDSKSYNKNITMLNQQSSRGDSHYQQYPEFVFSPQKTEFTNDNQIPHIEINQEDSDHSLGIDDEDESRQFVQVEQFDPKNTIKVIQMHQVENDETEEEDYQNQDDQAQEHHQVEYSEELQSDSYQNEQIESYNNESQNYHDQDHDVQTSLKVDTMIMHDEQFDQPGDFTSGLDYDLVNQDYQTAEAIRNQQRKRSSPKTNPKDFESKNYESEFTSKHRNSSDDSNVLSTSQNIMFSPQNNIEIEVLSQQFYDNTECKTNRWDHDRKTRNTGNNHQKGQFSINQEILSQHTRRDSNNNAVRTPIRRDLENSDTKLDYSPIPNNNQYPEYVNLGRVEHSDPKGHRYNQSDISQISIPFDQNDQEFYKNFDKDASSKFQNYQNEFLISQNGKEIDTERQQQILNTNEKIVLDYCSPQEDNKLNVMTFSHFDDHNIKDISSNNPTNNHQIRAYTDNSNNQMYINDNNNSNMLEGGANNYISSTFHSMCSELPHSTQKMFLTIENQIKESGFYQNFLCQSDTNNTQMINLINNMRNPNHQQFQQQLNLQYLPYNQVQQIQQNLQTECSNQNTPTHANQNQLIQTFQTELQQQHQQQQQQQPEANAFVLLQYEMVLQRIGQQFQLCLQRNHELEEALKISQHMNIQNQHLQQQYELQKQLQPNDYEKQIQELRKNYEIQIRQLIQERERMKQLFDDNEFQLKKLKTDYEELKSQKSMLQQQVDQQLSTQMMYSKNEDDLRKKIDSLHRQINEQEKIIRHKDEEIFQINTERMNLICDIKNLQMHDQQMKQENQALNQKRCDLEDGMNELKQQIYGTQINMRQQESQNGILSRQVQQLEQQQLIYIQELEGLRQQSINERQYNKEKELSMSCQIQKYDLDKKSLENENRQLNQLLEQLQRNITEQTCATISSSESYREHQVKFLDKKDQQTPSTFMQIRQDYLDKQTIGRNQSKDNSQIRNSYNQLQTQSSQEDHEAWWPKGEIKNCQSSSNASILKSNAKLQAKQNSLSVNKSQDYLQGILKNNNIQGSNNNNKQNAFQTFETKGQVTTTSQNIQWATQANNKENYQLFKQRNNQSQLSNVFSWSDQDQHPQQKQNDYQEQQIDQWQSNRRNNNNPHENRNQSVVNQSNSNYSLGNQNPIAQQKSQKQMLQDGSGQHVTFPSNQKFVDQKDVIQKLEQQLQSLQFEKQRMDVEFSKIPSKSSGINTISLKKKKEALEFDIEINQKNINTVKQKLRDLNAL